LIKILRQNDKAMFDLQKEHEKRMDEISEKYGHLRPLASASICNILLPPHLGEAFWLKLNTDQPTQSPEAAAQEKEEKEKQAEKRARELKYIVDGLIKDIENQNSSKAYALVGVQADAMYSHIAEKTEELRIALIEYGQILKEKFNK
jgi:hypothetical protein